MRIEKMIFVSILALGLSACETTSSGFSVRSVGFSPKTTATVARVADAVTPTPKCVEGEVLVTERDATVTNRSDSNGLRGAGRSGRSREQTGRQQRSQPQFVGQETTVRATSEQWCAQH